MEGYTEAHYQNYNCIAIASLLRFEVEVEVPGTGSSNFSQAISYILYGRLTVASSVLLIIIIIIIIIVVGRFTS